MVNCHGCAVPEDMHGCSEECLEGLWFDEKGYQHCKFQPLNAVDSLAETLGKIELAMEERSDSYRY